MSQENVYRFYLFTDEPGVEELANEVAGIMDDLLARVSRRELTHDQIRAEVRERVWPLMRAHPELGACDSDPTDEIACELSQAWDGRIWPDGDRVRLVRESDEAMKLYELIRDDEERP